MIFCAKKVCQRIGMAYATFAQLSLILQVFCCFYTPFHFLSVEFYFYCLGMLFQFVQSDLVQQGEACPQYLPNCVRYCYHFGLPGAIFVCNDLNVSRFPLLFKCMYDLHIRVNTILTFYPPLRMMYCITWVHFLAHRNATAYYVLSKSFAQVQQS